MSIFKVVFLAALAFLAAVAVFLGAIILLTSLQNGAITLSYGQGGQIVTDTVARAAEPDRFWRLLAMMGALPFALGAATLWYSVRRLRGG